MGAGLQHSDADIARTLAATANSNSWRDTVPPYVDNRPMFVGGKPELREYKAVFVVGDQDVSQFSDDIIVNCTPLV